MKRERLWMSMAAAVFLLVVCACGGKQADPQQQATADPQLPRAFVHAVVTKVHIEPEFSQHYPEAASQCHAGLLSELRSGPTFKSVAGESADTAAAAP